MVCFSFWRCITSPVSFSTMRVSIAMLNVSFFPMLVMLRLYKMYSPASIVCSSVMDVCIRSDRCIVRFGGCLLLHAKTRRSRRSVMCCFIF